MGNLQELIKEEFSRLRSTSLSSIYRSIGHAVGRYLPGTIYIAQVGVCNKTPIAFALAEGIGEERYKIIVIDPDIIHHPGAEYRRGLAEQLPLQSGGANILLYNDTLRFILSADSRAESFDPKSFYDSNEVKLSKVCSEIERIIPDCVIFRDPALHPIYKGHFKTPEELHKLILENLKPKYEDIGFEGLMGKFFDGTLESWLFLLKD